MFYAAQLLSGPLRVAWLAAHVERRLKRSEVEGADVGAAAAAVLRFYAGAPLALRLVGQLLLGIARLHARQAGYVREDAEAALARMRRADTLGRHAPGAAGVEGEGIVSPHALAAGAAAERQLPPGRRRARTEDITLPAPGVDEEALLLAPPSPSRSLGSLADDAVAASGGFEGGAEEAEGGGAFEAGEAAFAGEPSLSALRGGLRGAGRQFLLPGGEGGGATSYYYGASRSLARAPPPPIFEAPAARAPGAHAAPFAPAISPLRPENTAQSIQNPFIHVTVWCHTLAFVQRSTNRRLSRSTTSSRAWRPRRRW